MKKKKEERTISLAFPESPLN